MFIYTVITPTKLIIALLLCCYLFACATQSTTSTTNQPPQDINSLVNNSLVYAQRGALIQAQKTIQEALAINPNNVDANNMAGLIYGKTNQPSLAVEHFEKALSKASNDASTLNNYGNFLCDHGKTQDAEKKFLRAATHVSNPHPEIAYTNAGLCSMRVPNLDQAAAYFKSALDYQENNTIALFQLAQINFTKNRGVPALERLHAYAQYGQHSPATLKLGIEIGRLIRDKEVEVGYFNLLQNNFPTSEEYQWALATIN